VRAWDIKIAKWRGWKSHDDMDFGSYLTYPELENGKVIDFCPSGHRLYANQKEAWLGDTPHYTWRLMILTLVTLFVLLGGLL
jgi:hypothetical protein